MSDLKDVAQHVWIKRQLDELSARAWRERLNLKVYKRARDLTDRGIDRQDKICLLVDELHRRCVYAPDPIKESVGTMTLLEGDCVALDADDACLLLAAFAMSVGIPCRLVGARFGKRGWTCFVAYEDEGGRWVGVDPLRQKTTQVLEELVFVEIEEEP